MTASGTTVTDIDGNLYNTIGINTQLWMAENLKTTRLRDGTAIQLVTDDTAWGDMGITGAKGYCWYDNDEGNKETYGALYNWYTATNPWLCPTGWRVPAPGDWWVLYDYLASVYDPTAMGIVGGPLKEAGTTHWETPNSGATNETGFTALPGGKRFRYDGFTGLGQAAYFWSRELSFMELFYDAFCMGINTWSVMPPEGMSVRCIKQ